MQYAMLRCARAPVRLLCTVPVLAYPVTFNRRPRALIMADDTSSASEATTSCVSSVGYSGEEESSVSAGSSVLSLLDKLRSPVPSELARKRKVSTNPPTACWLEMFSACTMLKSASPQDRVREFADDSLCVSAGKLFCRACREELMKKSVVSPSKIKRYHLVKI